nr:RNA-directed DNA polymerase, eukaryota [Tanacetum cinerariifolium]
MVLGDECVGNRELENYVMGEVKDFASINNLYVLISNEGFQHLKLVYLGGLWVMIELSSPKAKSGFLNHVGVASWFRELHNAQADFVSRERIVWVDIEGVPLHVWSRATFSKIGSRWGEVIDLEESTDDSFARKRICIKTSHEDNILERFKIIARGKVFILRAKELFVWSPSFKAVKEADYCSNEDVIKVATNNIDDDGNNVNGDADSDVESEKEASSDLFNLNDIINRQGMQTQGTANSGYETSLAFPPGFTLDNVPIQNEVQGDAGANSPLSCHLDGFISRVMEDAQPINAHDSSRGEHNTKTGGSMLDVLENMIKETKLDVLSDMTVKILWGNHRFEFIMSDAAGISGGILYVWDLSFFRKKHHIISDNFVALYGTCIPKKDGHCLVMGDFNEARYPGDRMGTMFNAQGANEFNCFISNSRLIEVQLEGYSFTWSHPSANKLSKLDRFFVSYGLLSIFPHMLAVCLDRNLSDHRPILLREVLHEINIELDKGGSNDDVLLERMDQLKKLNDIHTAEARDRFQKAKIQWAIEADENSKFFHGIINRKRTNLAVKGVMVDGEWLDEPCHDILGDDFCAAIDWFFEHCMFARGCNSSFITLSPKTQDPKFVSDFRPISLIGSLYKVVTKILANRLSLVISGLISDVQTAFLPNRQIVDVPFIINELLSWCKYKKQQAMVFKVDFAKAYDSVRWDFLDDVLDSFSFASKWHLWIRGSLYSGMALVILNGNPSLEFEFHRGLKQGIRLNINLSKSHLLGVGVSFESVSNAASIIDDAVFIGEWIESNLSGITQILRCFSLLSGLNINLSKSHLLGVGVSFESVSNAASIIGCSTMRTPFKYLGVMVGDNTSKVHAWDETISKVWIAGTPLRDLFPRIYALETFKGCSVASKLVNPITLSLCREVRGGVESDQLALLEEIIGTTILSNMEDRWVKFVPIKINVFAWKLYLDRLPTRSNLLLREKMSDEAHAFAKKHTYKQAKQNLIRDAIFDTIKMEMHRLREFSEKVLTDNFYGTYNGKVKEALGRVKARLSKMLQEAACGGHEVVINSWRD